MGRKRNSRIAPRGKIKMKTNYIIGFTTDKGLMLDLDNTPISEVKFIASYYCSAFKLEGYIVIKSSQNNYQIIWNKKIKTWKKLTELLLKITWHHYFKHTCLKPSMLLWAVLQIMKGSLTLRISKKKKKKSPKIVISYGKQDKLIKEYLSYYLVFNKRGKKQ